jgi:hypothetical protein
MTGIEHSQPGELAIRSPKRRHVLATVLVALVIAVGTFVIVWAATVLFFVLWLAHSNFHF